MNISWCVNKEYRDEAWHAGNVVRTLVDARTADVLSVKVSSDGSREYTVLVPVYMTAFGKYKYHLTYVGTKEDVV